MGPTKLTEEQIEARLAKCKSVEEALEWLRLAENLPVLGQVIAVEGREREKAAELLARSYYEAGYEIWANFELGFPYIKLRNSAALLDLYGKVVVWSLNAFGRGHSLLVSFLMQARKRDCLAIVAHSGSTQIRRLAHIVGRTYGHKLFMEDCRTGATHLYSMKEEK